jgi:sugar phosphate isomerase/epimerase
VRDFDRRQFLVATGATLASGLGPFSAPPRSDYPSRIERPGIQLYSVRHLLDADFEGTLARLAELGYAEVEFAGLHGRTPAAIRTILDRTGLRAPSGHIAFEAVRNQPDQVIDEARILGHEFIVVAWIDADLRTPAGLTQVAELFNRTGDLARRSGLGFAYHNHDFEFKPVAGTLLYDRLLEETDPALVRLELDLYWIRKGGADPLAYFARYPGRFPMVHLKDMAADGRMVDLGMGVINWGAILSHHREAGIEHFFAEHDDPKDPLAFARNSVAFLRRLRF